MLNRQVPVEEVPVENTDLPLSRTSTPLFAGAPEPESRVLTPRMKELLVRLYEIAIEVVSL
jgi:hypothetical protein